MLTTFTPLNGEEENEAWLVTIEEDSYEGVKTKNQSENFEATENID